MKGFTLVEILVSIIIFSIICVGIGLTVVAGRSSLFTADVPTQLRQNLIFSIMTLSRELRETTPSRTDLAVGASANSISFQVPFDNNGDGSIVDTIGNIEWGSNITYSLNGSGQLIRTQAGTTRIISPNITILQFSRPAGEDRIIQIDITTQKATSAGNWQDSEQARLKMRN